MPHRIAQDLRDRFVGFAFAAADMLAEIDGQRRVSFAAGAFREKFGVESDTFVGQPFAALIAPEDHGGLEIAFQFFAARGRLTPICLRLANAARTPMALSGLQLPNHSGVAWLTLARLPAAPPQTASMAAAATFEEAMAARGQMDAPGQIGLLEVGGWQHLEPAHRLHLETGIAQALRQAGGAGAMATDMADGRFGVLGDDSMNLAELQAQVGAILRAGGAARPVGGLTIPLAAAHGSGMAAGTGEASGAGTETMRAMRFALACFSSGGMRAVREAGFEDGLRGFLSRAGGRAASVRSAIERGRFRLVFQPVVRLADRKVHHYEALLRPFPVAGYEDTSTQEFVRFVEAVGLAETLDAAVLRRVGEALKSARARVAINISGISMQSAAFRDELLQFISQNPDIGRRLLVELTETADIDDVPGAVNTVSQLAEAGVPLCLDDFGAGFAAFRYLQEFKVEFVKIDGSFVRQAAAGARENGFISAMVELARCVGANTIAEMVETEEVARIVEELGVQFGQGWLFGRPGSLPGSL